MKVRELIAALQAVDPDLDVVGAIDCPSDRYVMRTRGGSFALNGVESVTVEAAFDRDGAALGSVVFLLI